MSEQLSEADVQRIAVALAVKLQSGTPLTYEQASKIAEAAAFKAVNESHVKMWAELGFDMANKDDRDRFRKRWDFLDRLFERSDRVGQAVSNAIAVAVALLILGALGLGLSMMLRGHPPPTIRIR